MANSNLQRATELRALGYAAYRAGNYGRARKHFERALALYAQAGTANHPDALTARSDIGAACSAMGDHQAARAAHEAALQGRRAALGETHHDVGISLHNLGAVHNALGDLNAAEHHHLLAAALWRRTLGDQHPFIARALASLSAIAMQRGKYEAATNFARQVLAIRTQSLRSGDAAIIAAHDALATCLMAAQNYPEACLHWEAAIANLSGRDAKPAAGLHLKIGMAQRRFGDLPAAAASFAAAVHANPALTAAHHNLAATLTRLGRGTDAKPHRDQALRQQSVFTETANPAAPSVLILSIADDGNIPLDHILPEHAYTRIWWFIDHARNAATDTLPRYDIVFNAIGDPDMSGQADAKLASFKSINRAPFLNDPARVAATRRDRLPALLHGVAGLTAPAILRLAAQPEIPRLIQAARNAGLTVPLLLRPAGAHGGHGVLRIDNWLELDASALQGAKDWYLAPFRDYRSPDGYFRKYRTIFVDRQPYPYHLAISPNWLVHYYTSDMEGHQWKLAEEARFLNDPRAAIGDRAWTALQQAGQLIDLDYCGMDFTIQPDGTVFVFEANATMLVHPEKPGTPLSFKNKAVQFIIDALQALIASRTKPLNPSSNK